MKTIKKYLNIYTEFLKTSLTEATSYRSHFIMLLIMDLVVYGSIFYGVIILYHHVDQIGPWNKFEFLFFVAFILLVEQIHRTLVAQSFWKFSDDLRLGKLDFLLLKPVAGIFIVFFRHIRISTVLTISASAVILILCGIAANLSMIHWIILPFLVLIATYLMISIEITIAMSMFWTIQSIGINFLRLQFQSIAQWPDFIYQQIFRRIFTLILPVLLIGSAPARFLFNGSITPLLLMIVMALFLNMLTFFLWRIGLKRYESASS